MDLAKVFFMAIPLTDPVKAETCAKAYERDQSDKHTPGLGAIGTG